MRQCPQCNRTYTDSWITFCSDDGSLLREILEPPPNPYNQFNANPYNQHNVNTPSSEQATMWLPKQPPADQGWVAPDQRPPMYPVFQPPPPPAYVRAPSQGLAVASMITGIVGLVVGTFCLGPLPGIVALALGLVALSQIKKYPDKIGGKPFAIIGVVLGSLSMLFYGALFLFYLLLRLAG